MNKPIIRVRRQIVVLGPWEGYLNKPRLYELIEVIFHKFKYKDSYIRDFEALFERGSTNLVSSQGVTSLTIKVIPTPIAIPTIVSTTVPRINVLGSLTQLAWLAIILDAFRASGHIVEAEYTRQASIPTVFVRRFEGEDETKPCYVVSLYATRIARLGKLREVTQKGMELEVCKDIILSPQEKGKVKIKGSTGMLRDLTGSIYVTVAFNKKIVRVVEDYISGKMDQIGKDLLNDIARCMECAVKVLLEQYRDKLEFM